ncbi:tape measure protein [Thermus sp. PS18]|uniref:tape measure protein n=1 Tax=Thermus sp. PS18 TaxID=2849039 RepID=UPI0022644CC0|nr:tape measure protein [Thermus sp. PS18]UZX16561.1 tape measure protein [Thermus sp. PS18]
MARNVLELYIRLIDQVTSPARRVERALAAVEKAARAADYPGAYRVLRTELALTATQARLATTALYAVGGAKAGVAALVSGFVQLRAAVSGVAGQVLNLRNLLIAGAAGYAGKLALDAASFKESTLAAFQTLTGSREEANRLLREAVRFANRTPFDTGQIVDAYQRLLTTGFRKVEIPVILKGVGDLAALKGFSPEVIERVLRTFEQIRGKKRLLAEELMQLAEVGIPLGKVYEVLAKRLGTTVDQVRKLQEAGKIGPNLGITAVLEVIRTTFSGGRLGSLMELLTTSIPGLLSNLRSRPLELLMDLDETPGVAAVKRFLMNIERATNPDTATGKRLKERLQATFSAAFTAIFSPLARATEPGRVEALVDRALDALDRAVAWVRRAAPVVRYYASELWRGFTAGVDTLRGVWSAVRPVVEGVGRLFSGPPGQKAGLGLGQASGAARAIGYIAALAGAWRLLNLVTLGGAGALLRWSGVLAAQGIPLALRFGALLSTRVVPAVASTTLSLFRMGAGWMAALGPIGWVAAAILAVGAAVAWAWNRFPAFRKAVIGVWESIRGAWGRAVEWFRGVIGAIVEWFRALPERVGAALRSIPGALRDALVGAIRAIPGGSVILSALERLGGAVRGALEWGQRIGGAIVEGGRTALGVRSPSREWMRLGEMSALGLARGIQRAMPVAVAAAATLAVVPEVAPVSVPRAPVPAATAPVSPAKGGVVLNLYEGAIRVSADGGDPTAIARAIRQELVRMAMEVGHV